MSSAYAQSSECWSCQRCAQMNLTIAGKHPNCLCRTVELKMVQAIVEVARPAASVCGARTMARTAPVRWSIACHNQRCCFLDCTKLHISSISASATLTTIAEAGQHCICCSSVVLTCSRERSFFLMFQLRLLGWFLALVPYRGCHCHSRPCPRSAALHLAGSLDSCTLEWRNYENTQHCDNGNAVFLHRSCHSSRHLYCYSLDSRLVPKPYQQELKNSFILSHDTQV